MNSDLMMMMMKDNDDMDERKCCNDTIDDNIDSNVIWQYLMFPAKARCA